MNAIHRKKSYLGDKTYNKLSKIQLPNRALNKCVQHEQLANMWIVTTMLYGRSCVSSYFRGPGERE